MQADVVSRSMVSGEATVQPLLEPSQVAGYRRMRDFSQVSLTGPVP